MVRLIAAFCLAFIATASLAEIPDRRVAISRNVDFYGSDLQNIFDTTLDACQTPVWPTATAGPLPITNALTPVS